MQLTHTELRPEALLLFFSPAPDVSADLALLRQWLGQFDALRSLQAEQGADLLQISFEYHSQRFYLRLEHYSASCWVEADTAGGHVLLSALQTLFTSTNSASPRDLD